MLPIPLESAFRGLYSLTFFEVILSDFAAPGVYPRLQRL